MYGMNECQPIPQTPHLHHIPYARVKEEIRATLAACGSIFDHGVVGRMDKPAAELLVPPPAPRTQLVSRNELRLILQPNE
jgi:hypothetical protein